MQRRWVAALLALGAISLGFASWCYAVAWHPPLDEYPVQGVDISALNGTVDWAMLHARGVDFAYLRASDGTARDPAFEAHWAALPVAGIRRGAMHRFSLCHPASAQARTYITTVPRYRDALPGVLVLEFDPRCANRPDHVAVMRDIRVFLGAAEHHLAEPMLLRISPEFEATYGVSAAIARPLWATGMYRRPDYLARPWRMWRASTIRRIDGVAGAVNWSVAAP